MYILLTSMDCNEAILLDSAFFNTIPSQLSASLKLECFGSVYIKLLSLQ